MVMERHKQQLVDRPHYHILIHQTVLEPVTTERMLRWKDPNRRQKPEWEHGFTHAKIVDHDTSAAYYIAKYVSKEALARICASAGYGKEALKGSPLVPNAATEEPLAPPEGGLFPRKEFTDHKEEGK